MTLSLTIIFGIIGLLGVVSTIYYGRKASRLEKERKSLNWSDVQIAASDLAERIRDSRFCPSILLSPNSRGGIVGEAIAQDLGGGIPILVGLTEWKNSGLFEGDLSKFDCFKTGKWRVGVPVCAFDNTDKRILIVDDWVMSGDSIQKIRSILERNGFQPNNIKSATLVATTVSVQNHKAPDYYWKETDSPSFFFPWGRAK